MLSQLIHDYSYVLSNPTTSWRHTNIWSHPDNYRLYRTRRHDQENSWSWPRSMLITTFWGLAFNQNVHFKFCCNQTILSWDIIRQIKYLTNRIFDPENSSQGQGHGQIWPWNFKVMVIAKVKIDGHIWSLAFNRYMCFSFCGNHPIFFQRYSKFYICPWKFKVSSWPKSNQVILKSKAINPAKNDSCSEVIACNNVCGQQRCMNRYKKNKVTPNKPRQLKNALGLWQWLYSACTLQHSYSTENPAWQCSK